MPAKKKSREQDIDEVRSKLNERLTDVALAAPLTNNSPSDRESHLRELDDVVARPSEKDLESPESADAWADAELRKASPDAVREVIWQSKYGDSKQRLLAAIQILDRTGHHKDQNTVTNIAPVIVLTPESLSAIPWAVRKQMVADVDSEVVVNVTPLKDTAFPKK